MAALIPERYDLPLPSVGAAPLCGRCGLPQVDVHNAQSRHVCWHCVYCHNVPYVPLDWGVRWNTIPDSSAAPHEETPG